MNRARKIALLSTPFALAALVALNVRVQAADHREAPGTIADPAADITDVYAWHTDWGTLVTVIDFAGLQASGLPATYDEDVLYTLHIDRDADGVSDQDVHTRFGMDSLGSWGVQVSNMPGTGSPVWGPVEQVLSAPGGWVFAGLRDDPFFFDLTGFQATLAAETLMFDNSRDHFAGTNVTSIVLEMDLASALDGATTLKIWATTGRI